MSDLVTSDMTRFIAQQADLMNTLTEELEPLVQAATDDVVEEIQSDWPKRTGRSAEAWRGVVEDLTSVIENTVSYTEYVHGGEAVDNAAATFINRFEDLAQELEDRTTELLNDIQ